MANINELLERAASLRDETALNSISPERAGGIMYDTLIALNEIWLQQGAALLISKIYASVAAMEADTAPVSDLTGQPLRPGQIVVIASSDSDNGTVYRYNGTESPSWTAVGKIGNLEPVDSLDSDSTSLPLAAHQGKVLDGKISQLGQKYDIEDARVNGIIGKSGSALVTANQNFRFDTMQILAGYSYTIKMKSSAQINLVAITSDNSSSGTRYYWDQLNTQEVEVTFVALQSVVLQLWSADTFVPNDATITWKIAFSKVVEDKFEIINKAYQYGYLDANGDFQPNANFISSPFVDISDCTKIKFNVGDTPYYNESFNLIHYYDENKSHISTPDIHTITTDEIITIPASAKYVRYFVHTGYGFDLYGNTDRNTSTILYVGNTPQCDYTTIQDAIDNCNDSEENPVTIILLPGTYDPFTMRLPNQTPGTYAAMDRHISIIGIDKRLCKVVSTSGEYWKPCAEIGTTGVIANISFIHTASSLVSGGSAYAVHLDWPTDGRKETFKDCYFESNVGPAFGLGLHQDETVEFVNCTFIRTEGDGDDLGAFFGHLSSSPATNQNLIFKCCSLKNNITTSGLHPAISLSGTGSNGSMLFQNTICKNVNGPIENILGNWTNDEMSFNNIPTNLNA